MDEDNWQVLLKAVAPKARSDKEWAVAYAILLVGNAIDHWGEGICAELSRMADAAGAPRGDGDGEVEEGGD